MNIDVERDWVGVERLRVWISRNFSHGQWSRWGLVTRSGKLGIARGLHSGRVVGVSFDVADGVKVHRVVRRQPGERAVLAESSGGGVGHNVQPGKEGEEDEGEAEKDLLGRQQIPRLFAEFQIHQNEHHPDRWRVAVS